MADFSQDGSLSTARIAELLAPTLGWEKSSEVVEAAASKLRLPARALTTGEAHALLDDLSGKPGMVGIAARFTRSRLEGPKSGQALSSCGPASVRSPASIPRAPTPGSTVNADEVAGLLASAMGAEKAIEVVLAAVRQLDMDASRLDKHQALALLDHL